MSPFLSVSAIIAGIVSCPLSRCMKPRMNPCMYAWLHAFSNWRHSCIISYLRTHARRRHESRPWMTMCERACERHGCFAGQRSRRTQAPASSRWPGAGKRPDAALAGAAAPVACSRARRSCMLLRAPRCSGCCWWRRQRLLVVAAAYALSMSPFSIVSYFLRVSSGMPKSSSSLARRLLQSMFGRGRI